MITPKIAAMLDRAGHGETNDHEALVAVRMAYRALAKDGKTFADLADRPTSRSTDSDWSRGWHAGYECRRDQVTEEFRRRIKAERELNDMKLRHGHLQRTIRAMVRIARGITE